MLERNDNVRRDLFKRIMQWLERNDRTLDVSESDFMKDGIDAEHMNIPRINGRGKISGYHVDHVFKGVEKRVIRQHASGSYRLSRCKLWSHAKNRLIGDDKTLFNAKNGKELCEQMLDIMKNGEVAEAETKTSIVEILLKHNGAEYGLKLNRTMTKIITFFPLDKLIGKI